MSYFQEAFLQVYEPMMMDKGFHRKRSVFHRIVGNKIVQKLSYCMFSGQREYTIQFSFEPICCGDEISMFMDDARLGILLGNETMAVWDANKLGTLQESLELCQELLFPLFDDIDNYGSYLYNMNQVYIKRGRGRVFTEGIPVLYDVVYKTNLAIGNYEMAKKSREALITQNINSFRAKWGTETHPFKERQVLFEKMRDDFYRINKAIDENDISYIESYILENEKRSLNSYIRNFYGKKTFEKYQLTGEL